MVQLLLFGDALVGSYHPVSADICGRGYIRGLKNEAWVAYDYCYVEKVLLGDLQDLEDETVLLPVEQICRRLSSWRIQ